MQNLEMCSVVHKTRKWLQCSFALDCSESFIVISCGQLHVRVLLLLWSVWRSGRERERERERLASVFIHVDRIKRVDRKTSLSRRTLEETRKHTHTIFRMYTIKVRVRASIRVRGEKSLSRKVEELSVKQG